MTRTQYNAAASLDGFIADENGSLQWLFDCADEPENTAIFETFMQGVGAMVMGSNTYRWLVDHEDLSRHPERWQDYYGELPTWVLASGPLPVVEGANVRFESGEVAALHPEMLRSAGDKNLWVMGGGGVAAQFAEAGLLDDVMLAIAPVTLGSGAPVFPYRLAGLLQLDGVRRAGQFVALQYSVGSVRVPRPVAPA